MIGDIGDPRVCKGCGTIYNYAFGGCAKCCSTQAAGVDFSFDKVELPDLLRDGPFPVARCKTCSSWDVGYNPKPGEPGAEQCNDCGSRDIDVTPIMSIADVAERIRCVFDLAIIGDRKELCDVLIQIHASHEALRSKVRQR